jgi:hypothetical protein
MDGILLMLGIPVTTAVVDTALGAFNLDTKPGGLGKRLATAAAALVISGTTALVLFSLVASDDDEVVEAVEDELRRLGSAVVATTGGTALISFTAVTLGCCSSFCVGF